jgi:uncharacterized coiled-coil DUF342 family protein
MDQQLIAYLDERFREFSRQLEETGQRIDGLRGEVEGLRQETSQQFAELRQETTEGIKDLRQETTRMMGGLRSEVDGLRVELREEIRLTRVSLEGVRCDLQLLAEGVVDTRDLLARHEAVTKEHLHDLKEMIFPVYLKHLGRRVELLEEKTDRQAQDSMEVLRARFGMRQG